MFFKRFGGTQTSETIHSQPQLIFGVGGRGLCVGEAGLKPKTGKAAMSRNEAVKNRRSNSGVVFCSGVERREPSASGARALAADSPKYEGGGRLPFRQGWRSFLLGGVLAGEQVQERKNECRETERSE